MRYFFHTFEDGARIPDDDGVELANDEAARAQATQFLAEVAADAILTAAGHKFGVEVLNERGVMVTALGFTLNNQPDESD